MRAPRLAFMGLLLGLSPLSILGGPAIAEGPSEHAAPPAKAESVDSLQFTLGGRVMTPATYDRTALAALPQSTLTVGNVTYTGVPLWTLLSKASIITHAEIKNDILRESVIATATDGYKVAISLGEIDPDFGNQPCLIAIQQNGADFTSGGFAHLIFPNDVKKGRWMRALSGLKLIENP